MGVSMFLFKVVSRFNTYRNKAFRYCNIEKMSKLNDSLFESSFSFSDRLSIVLGHCSKTQAIGYAGSSREHIVNLADKTLKNHFNYLGTGWLKNDALHWNVDERSGFEWPNGKYYLQLKAMRGNGVDIKYPWELSRSHHLLWLGESFLITGEEKYATKIVEIINAWINDNPLMYSVNWTCSMDVAIRAVNWMYALNMIVGADAFTDEFAEKVSRSLYQHGFFIRHNLEKSVPWSNNHYLSDLVGLLYIGTLFEHTRKGRKWKRFALREFYTEVCKQTLPSGVNYEKSISYHRLMVELISYTLTMLKRTGESISEDIIRLTQGMYDYVGAYLKPNGKAPLLADNDDGLFLPFTNGDFRDHCYLLDADGIDQKMINIGIEPLFKLRYSQKTKVYEDAKIAILKENGTYLLVNNSGYSRHLEPGKNRLGTHTHNDQLSFEFAIGEDDIIIDPGTYLYTSSIKDRNEFRSTKKHNTVMVDDEEQNQLSDTSAFSVVINNKDRTIIWTDHSCTGSYETIKGGLKHERKFEVSEGRLTITDRLYKSGEEHNGTLYYHLDEQVVPSLTETGVVNLESRHYDIQIQVRKESLTEVVRPVVKEDSWSPSYGVLRPTNRIEYEFAFNDECSITTTIEWKKKSK